MTKECPECEGSGSQECSHCGAPDAEDCDNCDGTGEVEE